jgi:voltage-dependent calcium channel alpha-2/delta-3
VVGLQFKHSVFAERFFNITNKYSKTICSSEVIDCFLLDNNAFVIVSENFNHTGRFFGEIDNLLLQAMVTANVYRKVHMYDYQAICLDIITTSGPASMLFTPITHLKSIIGWVWTKIFMFYVHLLYNMWSIDASEYVTYDYDSEYEGLLQ